MPSTCFTINKLRNHRLELVGYVLIHPINAIIQKKLRNESQIKNRAFARE